MSQNPVLTALTIEQHASGFGIGEATPRLSWRFVTQDSTPQNWEQTGYELEITRSDTAATPEHYRVTGSASVLVPWPSTPLRSREQARVRVRAYGPKASGSAEGMPTEWSAWTTVETGLLDQKEWTAKPITSASLFSTDLDQESKEKGPLRPIRFRRTFVAPDAATVTGRARLYITSFGVYKAYINGQPVGDHEMAPGWTSYSHRLNYQVFDVAGLLQPGKRNVIAVEAAEGWYAGRLGFHGGRRYIYGDAIGVLAQLEVGSNDKGLTVVSDDSWTCRPSAVMRSEIYDGEVYDAREETPGWNAEPDAEQTGWQAVRELPFPSTTELVAPEAPPVRAVEQVQPVGFITTPSGKTIVDFGQNLVGRLLVRRLEVPRDQQVTFQHAEVLENGELGTRPLRVAKCIDTVISAGEPLVDWSPRFTFHGFRYVQVDGWTPSEADAGLLSALVLHTDMQRTGHFSCSHALVNKLHQNALWSMRGNFLSIPTDCPQRDERLGWTGDIQVFTPSASYLYNTAGMLGDWLRDLSAEQLEEGTGGIPPFVVPNVIQTQWPRFPQAIWSDVTVLTPWALYQAYGDTGILRRQYRSMLAWLDEGVRRNDSGDRLWDPELWQLGDWLDPTAPPESPGDSRTNGTLVADAYLVHVTSVMAQVAAVLGETADTARFQAEAAALRAAFQHKYVAASGLLVGDTQTALSLALVFGLHDKAEQAAAAGERLARLVRLAQFRVATGFAGTPIVTHALTQSGHHQMAYRMLQERERPSWMYPIRMGATTVWERWDSMLPDGSINPGEMTSFNHYALGSVVNWLHETVAGVRPLEPGWKTFRVAPLPGGTITSAETAYETAYGRLEVSWTLQDGGRFALDMLVPANSRALVLLPHERVANQTGTWVGSGRHHFASEWDSTANWPPKPLVPPMMQGMEDTFV